ncbi:HAD family hydrolase [Candidatus Bathyarchaeota archaeon]|jgi:HAD superfamily hydrolase (TIGR01549 family)|nr:HAD family hydrolase [Candidatus Bathyarchaeota archaeon]
MVRRFDLVVFDLDGTLIDNRVAIRENFNRALKMFGLPQLEDKKIDAMIGTPLVEMFERILPPSSGDLAPKLVDTYVERYKDTSHIGSVVLDDVIQVLKELRKGGFKLAVATTKANDTVYPLLQRIGLHKYFDLTTGRREGMRNKPHPDMLNYVMRELDVKQERTVMVGDTPVDVLTARNARIYMVVVTSSIRLGMITLDKIREAKPDLIISSLRELPCNLYVQ